jgi:predicted N-acetyltransferase YhbS
MVAVALLDGEAAADGGLLAALREIVNEAYARGEVGLWREGTERIADQDLRALVAAGQLAAAREDGRVVGCVRVTSLGPRTAELGLLAVAGERAGAGVGRALMAFAHGLARERGHAAMRLTLLVPREGSHPFKAASPSGTAARATGSSGARTSPPCTPSRPPCWPSRATW